MVYSLLYKKLFRLRSKAAKKINAMGLSDCQNKWDSEGPKVLKHCLRQSPNAPNGETVSILAMPPQAASNAVTDTKGFFDSLEDQCSWSILAGVSNRLKSDTLVARGKNAYSKQIDVRLLVTGQ